MPDKLHIFESKGEQGDFCDVTSGYEYQVGNVTDAVAAESQALEQGHEVHWLEASIDPNIPYEVQPGQQFTRFESTEDGQGVDYSRRS